MESPKILPTGTNGVNGTWDSKVSHAATGAHATIDKMSEAARPAVDHISASAHQTIDRLSTAVTAAASTLSEKVGQMKELNDQLITDARVRVRDRPVTALAIAVVAGFLLSHLTRSR